MYSQYHTIVLKVVDACEIVTIFHRSIRNEGLTFQISYYER